MRTLLRVTASDCFSEEVDEIWDWSRAHGRGHTHSEIEYLSYCWIGWEQSSTDFARDF